MDVFGGRYFLINDWDEIYTVLAESGFETKGVRIRKKSKNSKLKSFKKDILKWHPNVHSEGNN